MKTSSAEHNRSQAPIRGLDEQKYRGQWLMINGKTGRILSHDRSLRAVQDAAEEKKIEDPVFYQVPSKANHYVLVE